ncbi:hypothetical protein PTI98_000023 [Pleurotus ostreatus]|nr:hypothetical protein PTI98_000023 [Pleurotus ostreatus]
MSCVPITFGSIWQCERESIVHITSQKKDSIEDRNEAKFDYECPSNESHLYDFLIGDSIGPSAGNTVSNTTRRGQQAGIALFMTYDFAPHSTFGFVELSPSHINDQPHCGGKRHPV